MISLAKHWQHWQQIECTSYSPFGMDTFSCVPVAEWLACLPANWQVDGSNPTRDGEIFIFFHARASPILSNYMIIIVQNLLLNIWKSDGCLSESRGYPHFLWFSAKKNISSQGTSQIQGDPTQV